MTKLKTLARSLKENIKCKPIANFSEELEWKHKTQPLENSSEKLEWKHKKEKNKSLEP
jgi:hypothetical protein